MRFRFAYAEEVKRVLRPITATLASAESKVSRSIQTRLKDVPILKASLLVGFLLVGTSFFFYSPALWRPPPGRFADFIRLCEDPLTRDLTEPIVAYRVTAPLIAYLSGLRGPEGAVVQYLANILTFAILFWVLRKRGLDVAASFLVCFGLALTQVAQVSNTWLGYPDSVTNLFLAIAMSRFRFGVLFVSTVLGTLNDERFLLGLPLVFLWHLWGVAPREAMRRVALAAAGAVLGIGIVLTTRYALAVGWIGPEIPPSVYGGFQWGNTPWVYKVLGIGFGFRWMWLVPAAAVWLAWNRGHRWYAGCLGLVLAAGAAACTMPADISRSVAQLFPGVICGAAILYQAAPVRCRQLLIVVVVASLLTPHFNVVGNNLQLLRPLPMSILRAILT